MNKNDELYKRYKNGVDLCFDGDQFVDDDKRRDDENENTNDGIETVNRINTNHSYRHSSYIR